MVPWGGGPSAIVDRASKGSDVCTALMVVAQAWLYLAAEKRLSNEFADTIGCAPATKLVAWAASAVDAAGSVTVGFCAGLAEACFVSGLDGF